MLLPTLGPRLAAIGHMVRPGATTADIGTDHGHLLVWLVGRGIIPGGYACDIKPKPLQKAVDAVAQAGLEGKIRCVLSDGLEALAGEPVDDIVVAGMGGELIAAILARSPFAGDRDKRYLLQPMTRAEALRQALSAGGYAILAERCVEDGAYCYPILEVRYTGEVTRPDALFLHTGLVGTTAGDDSALYLERVAHRLEKKARGWEQAGQDTAALRELIERIKHQKEAILW